MASPSFLFETAPTFTLQLDGRASSAGSSDFDELEDAQVQQLPTSHTEMPHLDLNKVENTQSLSYQGVLSPRQQSGKRYHGGYLQHRVPKAAGLLKSWKRKYFRLREQWTLKCCKISQALEEEERLLRTLSHPNVVSLEGVYERDHESPLRGSRGLAYLHRRCVLHRDIKPENILIHGNMVKIADFGLAKQLESSSTMLKRSCGTLEYAAPELLCGQPYGLKSDVFSLGIVLYVLLFGAFPFSVESAAALQCMDHFPTGVDVRDMSCLSLSNVQWRTVSPLAQDVLLQMLKTNDAERISAEELLSHPWFDHVDANASNAQELERVRIEDCEALGFAELLSRGFQVVKFGYKPSTTPHSTSLTVNFMEESVTWTARKNAVSTNKTSGKRGRTIQLREIMEIREGHSTEAFLSLKSAPPSELCLSIICPWRTLDLVVETPRQREFVVRGLRRLLPSHSL
ncbi:hypothetical protein PInf_017242 [Phytophthora infestans]|nr:hypothetical protein PInf_017242 [Phytophthora infestans]